MKSKLVILIVLILIVVFFTQKQRINNLISPNFGGTTKQSAQQSPNATPNAPKTYNFDSSTDLKKELDSINPQVLDSDFE